MNSNIPLIHLLYTSVHLKYTLCTLMKHLLLTKHKYNKSSWLVLQSGLSTPMLNLLLKHLTHMKLNNPLIYLLYTSYIPLG